MDLNIIATFRNEEDLHNSFPNDRHYDVKEIYEYHWNNFVNDNPNLYIKDTVFYNIERTLKCRTPKLSRAVFECPNCEYKTYRLFTCKSKTPLLAMLNTQMKES